MKRYLIGVLVLGLAAAGAAAQDGPWYVRGDFNGWSTDHPMNDDGDGTFSLTVDMSGQPQGNTFDWKVAEADWDPNYPPGNVRGRYQPSMTFHFLPGDNADGWNPAGPRVGWDSYTDWEVMGSMNGWSAPYAMTHMGGGLYAVDIFLASAGTYEFKFRAAGDWEINVGFDFRFNGPNASMTTLADDELHRFEIDVPNGRWRTEYIPEPASLLGLALAGLLVRRR